VYFTSIFHGEGLSSGRRWRVIPMYICTASIWTYDGNNLEALGARRTCKPSARVRNHQYWGCAQSATVVSAGTNTMANVLRWRELSRNKSRDECEMWPNRTAHTDTIFRTWRKKRRRDSRGPLSCSTHIARSPSHGENFRITM